MNFMYAVGSEVHSPLYKQNGVVEYRMYTETLTSTYNEYGVVFHKEDGDSIRREITEAWLGAGERHDF